MIQLDKLIKADAPTSWKKTDLKRDHMLINGGKLQHATFHSANVIDGLDFFCVDLQLCN